MVALATETIGSNQTTVSFSLISQSYRDLYVVVIAKTTAPSNQYWLETRYNDDNTSSYGAIGWQNQSVGGNQAAQYANQSVARNYLTSNAQFNGGYIYIPNYAQTTGFKISNSWGTADTTNMVTMWNSWRKTEAINKITISLEGAESFISGSIFSLYGIN